MVDLSVWDTRNLHLLPVSVSDIDSVVFVNEPQMIHGKFSNSGAIHLYTKQNIDGFYAQGTYKLGNRSGDPGPNVYTDRASPNIERLGPVSNLSAGYGTNRLSFYASAKYMRHFSTDAVQQGRIIPHLHVRPFLEPLNEVQAGFFRSTYKGDELNLSLQASHTSAEDYLFTQFFGTEIPVQHKRTAASLKAEWKATKMVTISAESGLQFNKVDEFEHRINQSLRWDQQINRSQLKVSYSHNNSIVEHGMSSNFFILHDSTGSNTSYNFDELDFFNQITTEHSKRVTSTHSLVFSFNNYSRPLVTYAYKGNWQTSTSLKMTTGLSYQERMPARDNTVWYWIREHRFNRPSLINMIPFSLDKPIKSSNLFVQATIASSPEWRFHAKLSYRHTDNAFNVQSNISSIDDRYTQTTDLLALPGNRYRTLSLPLNVEYHPTSELTFDAAYQWVHPFSKHSSGKQHFSSHQGSLSMKWNPNSSFSYWTTYRLWQGTSWPSYTSLNGERLTTNYEETTVRYSSQTPDVSYWDMGLTKYFMNSQIGVQLWAQNLLNNRVHTHPAAPDNSFTIYLGFRFEM